MRRETSVDGIVKIFFRLASDCLKQFYIIVTLQKRPKIDTLNFDKLLLQFVVVVIKQAVIKSEIILRRLANIKFQQKRSTKVLLGGHIYLLWFRRLCCTLKIYTHNPYKKAEYSEDGIQLKQEDDDAKENSLSLSPFISKIVETQLMSRTPEKLFFAMSA